LTEKSEIYRGQLGARTSISDNAFIHVQPLTVREYRVEYAHKLR